MQPKIGDRILVLRQYGGKIVSIEETHSVKTEDGEMVETISKMYVARLDNKKGLAVLPEFMFEVVTKE